MWNVDCSVDWVESTMNQTQVQLWINRFKDIVQEMLTTLNDDPDLLKTVIRVILYHDNAPAHPSILVRKFFTKNKTVFTGHGLRWIFSLPNIDKCNMFCYDWGDKIRIETGNVGITKWRVLEVFRGLEKTLT